MILQIPETPRLRLRPPRQGFGADTRSPGILLPGWRTGFAILAGCLVLAASAIQTHAAPVTAPAGSAPGEAHGTVASAGPSSGSPHDAVARVGSEPISTQGAVRAAERHPGADHGAVSPASDDAEATRLFREFLEKNGALGGFTAGFSQTAVSRASGESPAESGTVHYKRPGLWRWDYRDPEKKVVVVRGKVATIAVDGDRDVTRYELGGEEGSGIGRILEGGRELAGEFSAHFLGSGGAADRDEATLRLDPVEISDQYDYVTLRFHKKTLTVVEVVVVDPGGNRVRFEFSGFRPERDPKDSLFDPPPGGAWRRSSEP